MNLTSEREEPAFKKFKSSSDEPVPRARKKKSHHDEGRPSKAQKSHHDNEIPPEAQKSHHDERKPKLSEEDIAELRRLLKKRRDELKKTPTLSLKDPTGVKAELAVPAAERVPIFFSDIQHLVLFGALAQNSPAIPRWCSLGKCGHLSGIKILLIERAGVCDYLLNKESLQSLSESSFPLQLEVVMPTAYHGNLIEEFCSIPLSRNQRNNLVSAFGSLDKAVKSSHEVFKVLRAFFPVNPKEDDSLLDAQVKETSTLEETVVQSSQEKKKVLEYLPSSDKFPRTKLLLSAWQLLEEAYPMLLNASLKERFRDCVFTKQSYNEVNNFSPMYGLDCEMCITSTGKSECTRVSIVNEKLETILDTLVLPYNKITNYVTRFSGITASMMKDVRTRLEDVQKFIQENLEPDAILVGQSLNFDLTALKMMHPYCIDTSVIFNVTGDRYRKSKLSYLAEHFLKEPIQTGSKGHCSVEDATTSLRLVQLKLSQSIEFGDQVLQTTVSCTDEMKEDAIKAFKRQEDISGYATSLFSYVSHMEKHATIMASPEILEKYMDYLNPKVTSFDQVTSDGSLKVISNNESSERGRVTCVIMPSNQSVVERMVCGQDNFLSLGHIQLSEEESIALSVGEKETVAKLNNWVQEMQRSVPKNVLSLVLFCGKENSANGVCFLKLQTETLKPVRYALNESIA